MRILDRYINNSIITIFISTVLIFTFLYILVDITSSLDEFIDREVPLPIIFKYYLTYLPIITVQTSSMACLISVLFTFSRMTNNNEIIAMRASGLNFWQITRPALIFGLVVSAFVLFINEKFVPEATAMSKQIKNENMILEVDRIRKKKEKIRNLTFYGLKNRLYFIDTFDPEKEELKNITIIEQDVENNQTHKIIAYSGKWSGIAWKFYQCNITTYSANNFSTPIKVKVYNEKLMDIKETPDDFLKQKLNVAAMNTKELGEYIDRFADSGAQKALNNLRVDYHQKISYPIGNFIIVLVGLPFALMVKSRKGMTFTAIGMAIGIAFLYIVTNSVCIAFGKGGALPPILAAWTAPLIFSGIALLMIESNF